MPEKYLDSGHDRFLPHRSLETSKLYIAWYAHGIHKLSMNKWIPHMTITIIVSSNCCLLRPFVLGATERETGRSESSGNRWVQYWIDHRKTSRSIAWGNWMDITHQVWRWPRQVTAKSHQYARHTSLEHYDVSLKLFSQAMQYAVWCCVLASLFLRNWYFFKPLKRSLMLPDQKPHYSLHKIRNTISEQNTIFLNVTVGCTDRDTYRQTRCFI
jgi:hypothetical protein